MKNPNKSPLKDRPLRTPGQSLDAEIDRVVNEDIFAYVFLPFMLLAWCVYDWLLWLKLIKLPNPATLTILTIILTIYCFFRVFQTKRKLKLLRLGRDGEKAVGQFLESLRKNEAEIYHDLIGANFNIDHVVISEHGIFTVETKTYSKPAKGSCRIIVNQDGIAINGNKPENKIIHQALAQKNWLEKQIASLSGCKVSVQPVVVFPGWFIENQIPNPDVWIIEPKALPSFMDKLPVTLSKDRVKLISNQLSRFIRTTYDQ